MTTVWYQLAENAATSTEEYSMVSYWLVEVYHPKFVCHECRSQCLLKCHIFGIAQTVEEGGIARFLFKGPSAGVIGQLVSRPTTRLKEIPKIVRRSP